MLIRSSMRVKPLSSLRGAAMELRKSLITLGRSACRAGDLDGRRAPLVRHRPDDQELDEREAALAPSGRWPLPMSDPGVRW